MPYNAKWFCDGCPFQCGNTYETLKNFIIEAHESSISCGHEINKIRIEGFSDETSEEIYQILKENMKLIYENNKLKMKYKLLTIKRSCPQNIKGLD